MSTEREGIRSMGGPKRIVQAEPENVFTLVAIGANNTWLPFPFPGNGYDLLIKGPVIKPAEGEQRKRLLEDCKSMLGQSQLQAPVANFGRLVMNMIQIIGGDRRKSPFGFQSDYLPLSDHSGITFDFSLGNPFNDDIDSPTYHFNYLSKNPDDSAFRVSLDSEKDFTAPRVKPLERDRDRKINLERAYDVLAATIDRLKTPRRRNSTR